jgi:hypothetical protein
MTAHPGYMTNIPESAFEFHGVREGQGRRAEEAV